MLKVDVNVDHFAVSKDSKHHWYHAKALPIQKPQDPLTQDKKVLKPLPPLLSINSTRRMQIMWHHLLLTSSLIPVKLSVVIHRDYHKKSTVDCLEQRCSTLLIPP